MNVLSNLSQERLYNKHDGRQNGYQQYPLVHPSPSISKTSMRNPGFTLLRGHIQLMAMVPNIPENQVPTKIIPAASSHSFPPITPRMMPSIAQRYRRTPHYLSSPIFEESGSSLSDPGSGYYQQYPPFDYPSIWKSSNVPLKSSPSFHNHKQQNVMSMPTFETISQSPRPQVFDQSQGSVNFPYSHHRPPPYPIWPPQSLMSYHQMNQPQEWNQQASYQKSLPPEYPYPPHLPPPQLYDYGSSRFIHPYSSLQSQINFARSHASPYEEQQQFFPYAAQSTPCFFNYGQGSPPAFNPFDLSPCPPPQNCASLPILNQKLRKTPRRSKKKGDQDKDVYIVVEEEDITSSTSSSLSSADEYEIRRRKGQTHSTISKENSTVTDSVQETTMNKPEVEIVHDTDVGNEFVHDNLKLEDSKYKDGKKSGKKDTSVVVSVHDCFLSDSSEAELNQELTSDGESHHRRIGKRKQVIPKIVKHSGGMKGQVFEDLENDLNPDEVRMYTCEYLMELLASQDWNDCYIGLQSIVRLARHRPQTLLNFLNENGLVLWCTFSHITSPKSALCRAAIVTFRELFEKIPDSLDNHLDKITEKLVIKSLAPNKFIQVECDKALSALVQHCNLVKILSALEIMRKKPQTRAAGLKLALAKIALQVVQTAGVDLCLMNASYADKLLPMLFCFMMEPNSGIRTVTKEALAMLMNHLQFEAAVMQHVKFDRNSTEVFKKLDKMRGRTNRNIRHHHHCNIEQHKKPQLSKLAGLWAA